jgi:hypothetical protein
MQFSLPDSDLTFEPPSLLDFRITIDEFLTRILEDRRINFGRRSHPNIE